MVPKEFQDREFGIGKRCERHSIPSPSRQAIQIFRIPSQITTARRGCQIRTLVGRFARRDKIKANLLGVSSPMRFRSDIERGEIAKKNQGTETLRRQSAMPTDFAGLVLVYREIRKERAGMK
jgi:hypothetical protein